MLLKKTRTRKRNLIVFSRTFIIFVRGYASRTISSFPLSTVSIYSRFLSVSVEYRNLSLDRFERRNKRRGIDSPPLCLSNGWGTERGNEISFSFTISNESLFCLYARKNFEIIKQYREWIIVSDGFEMCWSLILSWEFFFY